MSSRSSVQTSENQKGVALLVMIIAIILAFSSYIISGLSINQVKIEQQKKIRLSLKNAKTALIANAITHADRGGDEGEMGYFPCPDLFEGAVYEGGSDGACDAGKRNTVGYLPWISLDTPILKDNSGSCLWYAVSSSYKNAPHSGMINEDSYGMFQVVDNTEAVIVGTNPEDRVVAMVFAPNTPLSAQARTFDNTSFCGKDYLNAGAYLEGDGVTDNGTLIAVDDEIDKFIHATANSESVATPYNDQFITITRDEIWEPILNRSDFTQKMENLTQALAMCLASYANLADNTSRRLPWPVITNLTGNDYRDNANYQDDAPTVVPVDHGYSGRFPFDVASSNAAIDAALSVDELFDVANCSALAVGVGATAATANLLDPSDPGPPSVPATEYRKLWNNWKDHFFYVLSKSYEPGTGGSQKCGGPPGGGPPGGGPPGGGPPGGGGADDCIEVNPNPSPNKKEYAGAVIFSGRRLDGVTRNNKSVVADYLEDGKAAVFTAEATDKDGNEDYNYTDPQTDAFNDIMYCIEDKPTVDDPSTPLVDETVLTVKECV